MRQNNKTKTRRSKEEEEVKGERKGNQKEEREGKR